MNIVCGKPYNARNEIKEWTRRIIRLILLVFFFWLALFFAIINVNNYMIYEEYTFEKDRLVMEVSACRIWLHHGGDEDITAFVNGRRYANFWNETAEFDEFFDKSSTYLKMLNPAEDHHACDITLESTNYPDLIIYCKEFECPIV
jgi:hypothetical protein